MSTHGLQSFETVGTVRQYTSTRSLVATSLPARTLLSASDKCCTSNHLKRAASRELQPALERMAGTVGFVGCGSFVGRAPEAALGGSKCRLREQGQAPARRARVQMSAADGSGNNEMDAMRARLAGLFSGDEAAEEVRSEFFDGAELRRVLRERFTVEYDVQPVVRNDRVYIHILWRYFEQVSFYMEEDQWAQHTEAVADLLKKWNAVDYFCDYVSSVKKKPVVGISVNVPIPGIVKGSPLFPSSGAFDD